MNFANICRCCLSKACYKDISNEYEHKGFKEVYVHMLWDTLNIEISHQNMDSRLICEDCVVRLRDATMFKKQVLQVEDIINKRIRNGDLKDNMKPVKEYVDFIDYITGEFDDEPGCEDEDCCIDDDNFDRRDDGFTQESDEENTFLIKMDPEEDIPLQLLQKNNLRHKSSQIKSTKNVNVNRSYKDANKKEHSKKAVVQKKGLKKLLPQLDRKENYLKLITNSNICLFESLKTKFRCFYCKNSYFSITELREHTQTHCDERYVKMCINRLQGMSFKCVDISQLSCRICSEPLKDLSDLKMHLSEVHEIKFSGEENMLIQYRLDTGFQCVMCEESFNTFFKLSVHMNTHYTNHVCEICGASYINRLSLRMHVNSRHKESKCSLCPVTFSNAYLKVKHMRKVHNTKESKRYCLLCYKTFRYTYMLEEHKIQVHGKKRTLSVCSECGKSFLSAVNLRTHIRCVHIKERNHSCSNCGMCFFTSCDRRRHERTHQEIRLFGCSYCDGRFKSKDSLRRHLKKQHGHLFNTDAQIAQPQNLS